MSDNNNNNNNNNAAVNVWATLPVPLSDILLHMIVPQYLTVRELLRLSRVSHRYQELLGAKTVTGNKLLAKLLKRESRHCHHQQSSGDRLVWYTDQLPTFGRLSVEQSLQQDALLVAQLRAAATRRRGLLLLPPTSSSNSDDDNAEALQELMYLYQPRSIVAVLRNYPQLPQVRASTLRTEFICVNNSGVDLYCHWISHGGQILVREGDCVPSSVIIATGSQPAASSFIVRGRDDPSRQHIFKHTSQVYHSFALCWEEGGPPFCIYQQRRSWYRDGRVFGAMHTHAVAVHPGGRIEELHCDSSWTFDQRSFTGSYDFYDRSTGQYIDVVAPEEETENITTTTIDGNTSSSSSSTSPATSLMMMEEGTPPPQPTTTTTTNSATTTSTTNTTATSATTTAKELARSFYGVMVPSISNTCWQQGLHGPWTTILGPACPLNRPSPIGEALWHNDQITTRRMEFQ